MKEIVQTESFRRWEQKFKGQAGKDDYRFPPL